MNRVSALAETLRRYRSTSSDNGFTLLEVMVAIAILAIALTTLIASQNQGLRVVDESQFDLTASLLAGQKISEIVETRPDVGSDSGDFGEEYPGFTWKSETSSVAFDDADTLAAIGRYLRRLDVTVTTADESRSLTVRRYFLWGTEK